MHLEACALEDLGQAICTFGRGKLPVSGADLLVAQFAGTAANAREHHGTYDFIRALAVAGIEAWWPDAVVLDFSELEYTWGDWMSQSIDAPRSHLEARASPLSGAAPIVIVAGSACFDGLESLLRDEMGEDPHVILFRTFEEAVAALDHTIVAHRSRRNST